MTREITADFVAAQLVFLFFLEESQHSTSRGKSKCARDSPSHVMSLRAKRILQTPQVTDSTTNYKAPMKIRVDLCVPDIRQSVKSATPWPFGLEYSSGLLIGLPVMS